ncbi:tyrosinase central domain protein [Seiridium cupressi]
MLRLVSLVLLTLQLLLLPSLANADAVLDLWTKGQPALDAQLAKSTTCSKDKLQIRKEWGDLTDSEKSSYINAVLCLTKTPSKLDPAKYPGAKSRYDDFVVVHINQTLSIHGTYWNWARWAADPEKSPIFDGTMLSMSGNGEKITHSGTIVTGNGGGRITSGPFKNMTVNLGPISPAINPAPPTNPRSDGYGYNPRCLRRDISNQLSSKYSRTEDIVNLIEPINSIGTFQDTLQSTNPLNVHVAGHYTISGGPGGDFYVSPGDPAFWSRHSMIDRAWTIWQMQDLPNRLQVIAGGTSILGFSSRAQSLDDIVDLNVVGPKTYKIRELVSVVDGPVCYYYA